ncbi:MAG: hypothetical protein V1784_09680 [bacterium]
MSTDGQETTRPNEAIEQRAREIHDCWCAWFHAQHPNIGPDDGPYNRSYDDIADKSWYRSLAQEEFKHFIRRSAILPEGMTVKDLRLDIIACEDRKMTYTQTTLEHLLAICKGESS